MINLIKKVDLKLLSLFSSSTNLLCVSDFFPLLHKIGDHKVKITYVSSSPLNQIYGFSMKYKIIVFNENNVVTCELIFSSSQFIHSFDITKMIEAANIPAHNGFFTVFQYQNHINNGETPSFTPVERGYVFISSLDGETAAVCHGNKETVGLKKNHTMTPLSPRLLYDNFHNIQHIFDERNSYILFLTNDSFSTKNFSIKLSSVSSNSPPQTLCKCVSPMSSALIPLQPAPNLSQSFTVSVHSDLSLPRPTVISYNDETFDIFHA